MLFGDHFKITAEKRYEWPLQHLLECFNEKKTLVEFCPNGPKEDDFIRPYFDFDGKADNLDLLPSPQAVYPHLHAIMTTVFGPDVKIAYAYKDNRSCLNEKKGVTENKMSHRIFITNYYTTAATMVPLVTYANTLVEKNEELKALMQHCYKPYGFDTGVYSRNRAMSLVTKPKSEKDSATLKKWDTTQPVEDFLITYIPPSTKAFDATHIMKMMGATQREVTSQNDTVVAAAQCTEAVQKYIAKTFHASAQSIKLVSDNSNDRAIITLKKKLCPYALREHSSNMQYVTIQKFGDHYKAFEKCHNSECAKNKPKYHKVSDNILVDLGLHDKGEATSKELIHDTISNIVATPLQGDEIEYQCDPMKKENNITKYNMMPGRYTIPLSNEYKCPICLKHHEQPNNHLVVLQGCRYVTCDLRPTEWFPNPPGTITTAQNQIIFTQNIIVNNTTNNYNQVASENGIVTSINLLPSEFEEDDLPILQNADPDTKRAFYNALSGQHCDIAEFFYWRYRDTYRCFGRGREWHKFQNHLWVVIKDEEIDVELRSEAFLKPFADAIRFYKLKKDGVHDIKIKRKKVQEVFDNLKIRGFRMIVMKDCEVTFLVHHSDFEETLNMKNLLPCTNGVVDLTTLDFRPGMTDDCMTMSTNSKYIAYDSNNETIKEIEAWFEMIQPDPAQRLYLQKLSGYFLSRDTNLQHVWVWTGGASNAKSFYVDHILKPAMGQFYATGNTQLLTRKRENANEANSALMSIVQKRLAVFGEPENREVIQASIIKQICGGDELSLRDLHQNQRTVKPTFKSVIICNTIPKVSEDSYAVWRRIRVVSWPFQFVKHPDPNNPLQGKLDLHFADKIVHWKPYILGCLVQWLKRYRKEGLDDPPSVVAHTLAYQEENDEYIEFRQTHIVVDKAGAISWPILRETFKKWYNRTYGKTLTGRCDDIKKYFVSKLCPSKVISLKNDKFDGFRGFSLVELPVDTT